MKKPFMLVVTLFLLICMVAVVAARSVDATPVVGEETVASHIITGPEVETLRVEMPDAPEVRAKTERATQTAGAALKKAAVEPEETTPEPTETPTPVPRIASDRDVDLIARTIWGEAEGVKSKAEQAAVAWCILNRVDYYDSTIESITLAPYQFYCRTWDSSVPDCFVELAKDVVGRWERERAGETDVGRTIPSSYLYFIGDGERNHFTIEWKGTDYWDWSMPDPYIN